MTRRHDPNSGDGIDRVYEFLLSDHPAARAERDRRRTVHHARQTANTDAITAWRARIDALGDAAPAPLRDLAHTMGKIADQSSLRDRIDETEPDDLWVARERRHFAISVRVRGIDSEYRYPDRYLDPAAATQPNLLNPPLPRLPSAPRPEGPGLEF